MSARCLQVFTKATIIGALSLLLISGGGLAAPIPLKVSATPQIQSASHAVNCEDRDFWGRTICDPVAGYTGVLALFTGVLVFVSFLQIGFLIRSDVTARRAADAAKAIGEKQLSLVGLQADNSEKQKEIDRLQYFGANHPRLEIKFIKPVRLDEKSQFPVSVTFSVINTGTSEALVKGSTVVLSWMRAADIPDPNNLVGKPIVEPRRFKVGATDRVNVTVHGGSGDGARLYLMGWIVYYDARGEEFGDSHTTYFLKQWNGQYFETSNTLPDWDFQF